MCPVYKVGPVITSSDSHHIVGGGGVHVGGGGGDVYNCDLADQYTFLNVSQSENDVVVP